MSGLTVYLWFIIKYKYVIISRLNLTWVSLLLLEWISDLKHPQQLRHNTIINYNNKATE